jgi:hypothetical protein
MKKTKPFLSTSRAVAIFEEMVGYRRNFCADTDFFRMTKIWEDLCDEEGRWSIRMYRSSENDNLARKAAVIAFGDRVILSVDEKLMASARQGDKLSNFILAHEFGHLALGHHGGNTGTKNFQMEERHSGFANVPPTSEELETNFSAVCFQCGVAILDPRWNAVDLAKRASSDTYSVRKFQRLVELDVFKRELARRFELERLRPKPRQVIL